MPQQAETTTVKAVRLENFAYKDWLAALDQRLRSRYPAAQFSYQRPSVVIIQLNTGQPWGRQDEEFFASLRAQAYFQRWEALAEVPPAPKANAAVYEEIGYRVGSGMHLTTKQQEVLFSQLHDLEARATLAEREAGEQRKRAESAESYAQQTVERHNHLVALLEEINRALQIKVIGDYEEACTVEDVETGQVLLRDIPATELYHVVLQLRLNQGRDGHAQGETLQ